MKTIEVTHVDGSLLVIMISNITSIKASKDDSKKVEIHMTSGYFHEVRDPFQDVVNRIKCIEPYEPNQERI